MNLPFKTFVPAFVLLVRTRKYFLQIASLKSGEGKFADREYRGEKLTLGPRTEFYFLRIR